MRFKVAPSQERPVSGEFFEGHAGLAGQGLEYDDIAFVKSVWQVTLDIEHANDLSLDLDGYGEF